MIALDDLDPAKPVLIYGPTASGKSGLALQIAEAQGGVIINADALQIYQGWPILSAQPSRGDLNRVPHLLYGQVPFNAPFSVGDWLRLMDQVLAQCAKDQTRPIIVGGTGLYFTALTEGLADIPITPEPIRAEANTIPLPDLIAQIDARTAAGLDLNNRARVQRAWEVQRTTGRSIRDWQDATPPPMLPLDDCTALALSPDVAWLNARIAQRFDVMMSAGALNEARAMHPNWDPDAPSSKTIGAREMIEFLDKARSIDSLRDAVLVATRQYAKRQRTWLRSRMEAPMKGWRIIPLPDLDTA